MDSPANVSWTITPILAKVSAGMPHKRLKISCLVGKKLSGQGFLTAESRNYSWLEENFTTASYSVELNLSLMVDSLKADD
jgi:hypothetical protein